MYWNLSQKRVRVLGIALQIERDYSSLVSMLGDPIDIAKGGSRRVEGLSRRGNKLRKTFGKEYLSGKSN